MPAYAPPAVTAIIVTHNSGAVLARAVAALRSQTSRPNIIVVDSGSDDCAYIEALSLEPIRAANIGFAAANNLGIKAAPTETTHFLFVNPDCFLEASWLEKALAQPAQEPQAFISSPLYGYDLARDCPSGLWDSCGIGLKPFSGRWFDIGQGQPIRAKPQDTVRALCGALMLVPAAAVRLLSAQPGGFFDERFYMYKEDIDTSLRLVKAGYTLKMLSQLTAYHCRGWQPDRRKMPRWARLYSARNNLRLLCKHPRLVPYGLFYLLQYLLVRYANR